MGYPVKHRTRVFCFYFLSHIAGGQSHSDPYVGYHCSAKVKKRLQNRVPHLVGPHSRNGNIVLS